jgi:hypothetical protein
VTREFFELARDRLHSGGMVIVNVGHPEGQHELDQVLGATMGDVFRTVVRDPSEDTNTMLLATGSAASGMSLRGAAPTLPPELRAIAVGAAARLTPRLKGGTVYTDDKAPVEWLVDKSIVQYAADGE